jgi:hypothetical protein
MSPDDLNFACTVYAKRQEKIEAHKLQKWDVVKWAVTINVALASAAYSTKGAKQTLEKV